jgi:tetratricopeptide (TPR) repeat protein
MTSVEIDAAFHLRRKQMLPISSLEAATLSSIQDVSDAPAASRLDRNASALYPADLYPADVYSEAGAAFAERLRLRIPSDIWIGGNSQHIVEELDTASALAGLASLCMKEGNFTQAQQYLQEANDIRNGIRSDLTPCQQSSLDQIMSLQQEALNDFASGHPVDGQAHLDQATQLSQSLRNSVLSSGQVLYAQQALA